MILSAGVDGAEESEHRLGLVAGVAEETTVVVVGVGVVGGEEETDRLQQVLFLLHVDYPLSYCSFLRLENLPVHPLPIQLKQKPLAAEGFLYGSRKEFYVPKVGTFVTRAPHLLLQPSIGRFSVRLFRFIRKMQKK